MRQQRAVDLLGELICYQLLTTANDRLSKLVKAAHSWEPSYFLIDVKTTIQIKVLTLNKYNRNDCSKKEKCFIQKTSEIEKVKG